MEDRARDNQNEQMEQRQFHLVLELFGISREEFRQMHQTMTLAEIGSSLGIDVDVIVETLLIPVHERVEDEIAHGNVGEEKAQEVLAEARNNITKHVMGLE